MNESHWPPSDVTRKSMHVSLVGTYGSKTHTSCCASHASLQLPPAVPSAHVCVSTSSVHAGGGGVAGGGGLGEGGGGSGGGERGGGSQATTSQPTQSGWDSLDVPRRQSVNAPLVLLL